MKIFNLIKISEKYKIMEVYEKLNNHLKYPKKYPKIKKKKSNLSISGRHLAIKPILMVVSNTAFN